MTKDTPLGTDETQLDTLAEIFRNKPTPSTSAAYRDAALDYWTDEMIGDESLLQILKEIRDTTLELHVSESYG
jgi:hypothetical protein